MSEEEFALPPRYNVPDWLKRDDVPLNEGETLVSRITDDMVAVLFWADIEARAEIETLKELRADKDWKAGHKIRNQSQAVQNRYRALLDENVSWIITALGRDIYAQARIDAKAHDGAFDRMAFLEDAASAVRANLLLEMQERGYFGQLEGEFNDAMEYLASKAAPYAEGKRGGVPSEQAFLIETLIPILEANGIPRSLIVGSLQNFWKTRVAVPYLRQLLGVQKTRMDQLRAQIEETDDENVRAELRQQLLDAASVDEPTRQILEELVAEMAKSKRDGAQYSVNDFEEMLQKRARGITEEIEQQLIKMQGIAFMLPQGGVLQIKVTDKRLFDRLQHMTERLVDWQAGDPRDLSRQAADALLGGAREEDDEENDDADLSISLT